MLKTEIKTQENALQEDTLEQGELVQIAENCEHAVVENCMETLPITEVIQENSQEYTQDISEKDTNEQAKNDSFCDDLKLLASLLDTTAKDLKEEFYLLQIRKIMSKLQKVIVRYNMTDVELENLFYCGGQYGLGGITVAPAYLSGQIKQNKKNLTGRLKITSIIDFPFGESSLKGKITNIKESLKLGANSLAVAMPASFIDKEQIKQFKKQCKKIYCQANWWKKNETGIVLNASDMNEESFSIAVKVLRKTKLSYIVLAFGDASIEEVKHKLVVLNNLGLNKKLYVLANVDRVEMAVELFRLKVDSILTPYADSIGTDLLKRFNLISK